ncbi:hypothetical protein JOQ06_026688 [Pogonophryne albipinna]|uniref:C2 domain-containing protein n=1 Tax=Pogonophryne albipinna TaxID=1090488 RepID=A0AAD6BCN4_9TELE|nr:hypothetical protein JOQ06_026688 [Pogonophryne albipinna]
MVYYLWRRKKKRGRSQYEELLSTAPSVPACTAPVILVSKESWTRPSEIPFTLPPRFTPLAHRGSLSVRMWYPVGTVLAGLYSSPPLNEVVAPPPGMATRLCLSVEYRHSTEQLMVSLLRLANLLPRFHGNITLVSGVCVPQSTLSVCVLSVGQDGKRHAVGRVLFPLEGELAGAGRVLWRDLETEDDTQCSELGDVQISLSYSPSLQRLSVVVPRARGLQLLTDAGVCVQVSLQIHTQVVKMKRSCVANSENDPCFDHRTTFKLRSQHLDEACLRFELQQPNPVRSEPPALLGVLVLGPFMYAKGPQLQHWMDMVNTPQEPVQLWHKLRRAT